MIFRRVLVALLSHLLTHQVIEELLGALFELLRKGVAVTPNTVDDKALAEIEQHLDKKYLAELLGAWLKGRLLEV
jgi:hypothetical protein